jgi:hypothetical protein
VKLGPCIKTPEKLVSLIRWYSSKVSAAIPDDDGWGVLDTIKVLSPRKKKNLIGQLRVQLAKQVFSDKDFANLTITHPDTSAYNNSTSYTATQGGDTLWEQDEPPELADLIALMTIDTITLVENLTSVSIQSHNAEYGPAYETSGPLLRHLYGEIRFKDKSYFLLGGAWYEVDSKYIDQVTKDFVNLIADLDLDSTVIKMRDWPAGVKEGAYNMTSLQTAIFVNGDTVLTDNVELFDSLAFDDGSTYIVHVKDGFDVKIRDVRSQIINSAQVIENDLRTGDLRKLKEHHAKLMRRGRTTLSQDAFLHLFDNPRVYVLAYGSGTKVSGSNLDKFKSSVARMELVSLNNEFRQISNSESKCKLRLRWIRSVP